MQTIHFLRYVPKARSPRGDMIRVPMIFKEGSIPGPHPEGAHATTHGSQRVVAFTVCARLVPQCPVRVDRHLQNPGHWLQEAVCVWAACMQESVLSVVRCHYLGTVVQYTS